MSTILAAYLTGIVALLYVDWIDRIRLEPMARAVWTVVTRRYRYTGRHWADGLSTMQRVDQARAEREAVGRACTEPTVDMLLPDFQGQVGPYQPKAGVGRYFHLRPEELAARAEHEQRAVALGVNLAALRVRAAVPSDVDEWVSV